MCRVPDAPGSFNQDTYVVSDRVQVLLENGKIHDGIVEQLLFSFSFFFFFHLAHSRWTSSLPSCLWSQRIFPSLPGSRLTIFLSRCKFSTLITRQPMVEFYLLTFPRFPLRKKEHKSYFGKNRTQDFRTSRCAAYLLDHSGDERLQLERGTWRIAASKSHKLVPFSAVHDHPQFQCL